MFGPGIWKFGRMLDPMPEVQRLQREMNRLFSGVGQAFSYDFPAINIWSGNQDAIIMAELPGIDPGKLDISVIGDTVTIRGTRDVEPLREGESYHRQERSSGRFSRTLQLPFHVDADKVEAKYEKGILSVTLPRSEADKPRKISIRAQ